MKSICVYCGSNAGSKPAYTERAIARATALPATACAWCMAAATSA